MKIRETYSVIRTTTEQLSSVLNEVVSDNGRIDSTTWLGGRDWVIIARDCLRTSSSTNWVEDMDRRHVRFDQIGQHPDNRGPEEFTHLIDPEVEWGDIRYGRYDTNRVPTGHSFTGWIEDRACSWIIFLGEHGAPKLYWPRRDENGGVIGSPVDLSS